jgi:N-glycosylase/DNA lyase
METSNWVSFYDQLSSDKDYQTWDIPADIRVGIEMSIERLDYHQLSHYFTIGIIVYSCPCIPILKRWQKIAKDTGVPVSFLD